MSNFNLVYAKTCVNLFSPRCKPINQGLRKFTQVTQVTHVCFGLRKFTHVNLMTQVYDGSPSQGHSGPGPAFVAAAPAVAAHPGPEPHGARLARPAGGLRRCRPRRRGASRAGAARGLAGPARPSPGWPCPAFVAVAPAVAAHPGPEPPGARPVRPVRPGLDRPARPSVADITSKICDTIACVCLPIRSCTSA